MLPHISRDRSIQVCENAPLVPVLGLDAIPVVQGRRSAIRASLIARTAYEALFAAVDIGRNRLVDRGQLRKGRQYYCRLVIMNLIRLSIDKDMVSNVAPTKAVTISLGGL